MLRAAQFAARFGFALSDAAHAAMAASANLVRDVSAERVHDELVKLLEQAPQPSIGLEILRTTGVLAHVWPEILEGVDVDQNEWHAYDVYRHSLATLDAAPAGDLLLRLAALLHDVGKPRTKDGPHFYRHEHVGADLSVGMLERLRFSRDTVSAVEHLVRQHMYSADPESQPKTIRRFVNRIGVAHLERLFALRQADVVGSGLPKRSDENERFQARVAEIVAEKPAFTVRDLALSGEDVVRLMVERGLAPADFRGDARVGTVLRTLFDEVVDEPERNERAALLRRAGELLAPGGASS
jgi:putative nucleotidyltransferase with HDIG domain